MNNQEIAVLLRKISAAYQIKGENQFRITAYDRAADSIEHLTFEAKDLWHDGKLKEISGIGVSIASHLDELFQTGQVKHFQKVMKNLPKAMFFLLSIAGFGARRAYKLVKVLKLKNPKTVVEDLEKMARQGKIAPLEGFGEKSQQAIIEAIDNFKKNQTKEQRMILPYADTIVQELIIYLKKNPKVIKADVLGSLRRMAATIGDIDIAVATHESQEIINWFLDFSKIKKVIEKGKSGASIILENGKQVDLRVQKPESYGAMLQYFTGSKNHNIKLRELALKKDLSLSEYGMKIIKTREHKNIKTKEQKNKREKIKKFRTEKELYQFLGLEWIPPELRENRGEIEAAQKKQLPKLIKLEDIKGDLHCHSNFDLKSSQDLGIDSFEKMIIKAIQLKYEYITFTEHNPSLSNHTEKQIITIMKRRKARIEEVLESKKLSQFKRKADIENHSAQRSGSLFRSVHSPSASDLLVSASSTPPAGWFSPFLDIRVLNGLEINILPDGRLALPEKAFDYIDFAIIAIHSSFKQSREKMTKRVLSAFSHPKARILAHPTGRLLNQREGYGLDWEAVFDFCKNNKKALEINCHPTRLDLPDILVQKAIKKGVKIALGSDAHSTKTMEMMSYGVSVARRGWCEKSDILNTLDYNRVSEWLGILE
ncbi:hypothetical protein ISS85_01430 [Candidatus Microgenomates bacterium]|nr:hypothetical protein [Candidatus Microgenomates bacterium]